MNQNEQQPERTAMETVLKELNDYLLNLSETRDIANSLGNHDQVSLKNTQMFIYEKIIEQVILPKMSLDEEQRKTIFKDGFTIGYKWVDKTIESIESRAERAYNQKHPNQGK